MKKNLENEICKWFDKLHDKYCQYVDSYTNDDIRETAQYFYNLALLDVMAMLTTRKAANEYFNLEDRINEDVHVIFELGKLTK